MLRITDRDLVVMVGSVSRRYYHCNGNRHINLERVARMHDQSTLHVDLSAVEHNCLVIRSHIGIRCKLCAVVKADGYGLGAVKVSSILANCADLLAVYSADEAGILLNAGIRTQLLILAPVYGIDRFHPLYRGIASGAAHLVVHSEDHLKAVLQLATRFGLPINVQVKVDTGLRRGGCDADEAKRVLGTIFGDKRVNLSGVMTHFSSANHDEEMTRLQHKRLDYAIGPFISQLSPDCQVHEANTAATVQWSWTHRNMVRVGIAWTGTVPAPLTPLSSFQPVVSWTTELAHVRTVKRGEQVGYGGKWRASRNSVIGIVPVGYAAGYPMGADGGGNRDSAFVHIICNRHGESIGDAPVVGTVCMDQIAVDLTELPKESIGVGCGVELLSVRTHSRATLRNVAIACDIVPHAVISRISATKVSRTYRCEGVHTQATIEKKLCI